MSWCKTKWIVSSNKLRVKCFYNIIIISNQLESYGSHPALKPATLTCLQDALKCVMNLSQYVILMEEDILL